MMRRPLVLLLLVVGCAPPERPGAGAACGIAAVAGPALVLSEFGTPGAALTAAPPTLPGRLVARFVAGPAAEALIGRRGDSLEVGIEGGSPAGTTPGFGVLLLDAAGSARGVFIYEGTPVLGATPLGTITSGSTRAPLIGVRVDPKRVEDPRCPFFPDSILR